MITFDTSKEIIEYMKCEGYDYSDFKTDCDYQPVSWDDVRIILDNSNQLHTFIGDWEYFGIKKMTQAQRFNELNLGDVADLMTSLDNAGLESEQDYINETTEWIFEDGSKIRVHNFDVEILDN